jgi:H+/gluconate symporter-like permease
MSLAGIALALILLMFLAYRGISVLLLAPAMAALAVLLTPEAPVLASYTQVFMKAMGGFITAFFPLFLLGSVFGKAMEASGAAVVIAKGILRALGARRAMMAVVLACAVLTYGGVSLFVVAFAVYPVAVALFRQADIPHRLIPAAIALGAFTFTMTAMPGTPAIQNAIPMPYFGTDLFAAPGLGLIASAVMLFAGLAWLSYRHALARDAGEHYADSTNTAQDSIIDAPDFGGSLFRAMVPMLLIIGLSLFLGRYVLPGLDTSYLSNPRYGGVSGSEVYGQWALILALIVAIIVVITLHRRPFSDWKVSLAEGAQQALMPMANTASLVGFGAVIATLSGFAMIREEVMSIYPDNPLISISIAVNLLAGITGSASGGMSIALASLGETWLLAGQAAGISPELLHRVITIATGGLDALPHNGAVITLLAICGLSHRKAYGDIFMVAVLFPLIALAAVVMLGSVFGAF